MSAILGDPGLCGHVAALSELAAGARLVRVLRHVPARRATLLLQGTGGPVVAKIFARPRARGNHRRLELLRLGGAGSFAPTSLGVHPGGHAGLISWTPGTTLDQLPDALVVDTAALAGQALQALHDLPVNLDRRWGLEEELAQLQVTLGAERALFPCGAPAARESAGSAPAPLLEKAVLRRLLEDTADLRRAAAAGDGCEVVAHRDCHPRQLVRREDGAAVSWIDLDDAAMAPRGLDVGNFAAHLWRDQVLDQRPSPLDARAVHAFLEGYGTPPEDWRIWARLSLARLAGLAARRHGDLVSARRISALLVEDLHRARGSNPRTTSLHRTTTNGASR